MQKVKINFCQSVRIKSQPPTVVRRPLFVMLDTLEDKHEAYRLSHIGLKKKYVLCTNLQKMKSSSLAPVSSKGCSTRRVDAIHPIVELNLAWGLKITIKLKS